MATFLANDLDRIDGDWLTSPVPRDGAIYDGCRAGTLRAPDGTLVEIVEIA